MRILLVYPSWLGSQGTVLKYRKAAIPPLALAVLDALTPSNHDVRVVNDIVEEIDFSERYDLVAITAMTVQAPRAYQIADAFRSRNVPVVIGGMHATALPEEANNMPMQSLSVRRKTCGRNFLQTARRKHCSRIIMIPRFRI